MNKIYQRKTDLEDQKLQQVIELFSGKATSVSGESKMKALLVQQGLQDALKDEKDLPKTLLEKEKNDILEKAQSVVILSLGDRPLEKCEEKHMQLLYG